ncbi:hypothetical protein [Nocardioides speluncae]|uniref:hypothetical protein n=1 Tax=Nocardioides speluncae TaxID=2670337 RepID=UPI000D6863A5|nr:hypothetical protein [Nocardioides speluncae]
MADEARSVTVRLNAMVDGYIRDIRRAGQATESAFRGANVQIGQLNDGITQLNQNTSQLNTNTHTLTQQITNGDNSLDRYSGRLKLLAKILGTIGPGLIPIGAVGIPAVTGLASALTLTAIGAGATVLAFQGVGDALDAIEKARLEPTVENIEAAQIAMGRLSPATQQFVQQLRSLAPLGRQLRFSAAEGLFPGFTEALDTIESRGPEAAAILEEITDTIGDLGARAADSLAGDEWDEFFDFLQTDSRQTLTDMGVAVGNLTRAFTELLMAFDPLNDDFTGWLVDSTDDLAEWADGLSQTEGFKDFVAYVRTNGPQVAATFGAIAEAAVDIVQAAAPIGGPVLKGIEALARGLSAIADSDAATPLIAMYAASVLVGRGAKAVTALRAAVAAVGITAASTRTALLSLNTVQFGAALAGIYGINAAFEKLTDNNLTETDLTRGLEALSDGRWTGNLEDVGGHLVNINAAMGKVNDVMSDIFTLGIDRSSLEDAEDFVSQLDEALAALVEGGRAEEAAAAFDKIVKKGTDAGVSAEDAEKHFTQYALALDNAKAAGEDFEGPDADGAARSLSDAARAAEDFRRAVESVNRVLAGRASWRDYEAAVDAAAASLREHGRTLNIDTAAGRANEQALDDMASTAVKLAENLRGPGRARFLIRAREDIIDAARAFGKGRSEARALADELLDLDSLSAEATLELRDRASAKLARVQAALEKYGLTEGEASAALRDVASGRIKTVQGLIDKYGLSEREATALLKDLAAGKLRNIISLQNQADRDITSTITINTIRNEYFNQKRRDIANLQATGGMWSGNVQTYASGGMDVPNGHQPEIAGAGAWRVWAEPETGGESYIPHANDHRRPRAKEILSRTADMFGGRVEWYADGGWARAAGPDLRRMESSRSQAANWPTHFTMSGRLDSEFGPAYVEGVASVAARAEIDEERRFDEVRSGR